MCPLQVPGSIPLNTAAAVGNSAPAESDPRYAEKARTAAEKFESFFIADMLHHTRSVTQTMAGDDSVYQNRINQDMLDMADSVVADVMSRQHAFGIADTILMQILPAKTAVALKSQGKTVALDEQGGAPAAVGAAVRNSEGSR
jgi:flagellar protein FlgJ